ncbi:MAG: hypothetical protein MHPSP_004216, partial [Paramarteilia canceri]
KQEYSIIIEMSISEINDFLLKLTNGLVFANIRFMVVIIYIGEKVYILRMSSVTGTANSENLLEVLVAKLREYNLILDKRVSTVTDGESVMKNMHTLNGVKKQLCINHGIH